MKKISAEKIKRIIAQLCIRANTSLRPDFLNALLRAYKKEKHFLAKDALRAIITNAQLAKREGMAICQDTGLAWVFVELGNNLKIIGDLKSAINKGVELGYQKASLRKSIIKDPLRRGRARYGPAVIHIDIVKGNKLKLAVLPKGFGSENKTKLIMLNPTDSLDKIKDSVVDAVKQAGPDACPPFVIGVGIGGTADFASFLAKRALLKKLTPYKVGVKGDIAKLEGYLLKEINKLNIGPMGMGGKSTCLGVNILTYPTHIAGLPVAINVSCHALRSAQRVI